jgi:hypothetical protein
MKSRTWIVTALGLMLCAVVAWAASVAKNAPIQFYLLERVADGDRARVNFAPHTEKAVLRALAKAGFNVQSDEEAPLVSKSLLKKTQIRTVGKMSEYAGRVYMVAGEDGELKFKTDKGENVVLKTEASDIEWVLDRKTAFASARKAGARYVMLVEVSIEPVHATGAIQRAFNVSLDASVHRASNAQVVASFGDSLTRQGATVSAAAKDAAEYLGSKLAEELE